MKKLLWLIVWISYPFLWLGMGIAWLGVMIGGGIGMFFEDEVIDKLKRRLEK